MSSFLEDLESEKHAFLLEKGNLPEARKALPQFNLNAWTGKNSWTSQGYIARVNLCECSCGEIAESLIGIFHRESTPSGEIREQALDVRRFQIPLDGENRIEFSTSKTTVCPSCLSSKGFSLKVKS